MYVGLQKYPSEVSRDDTILGETWFAKQMNVTIILGQTIF